MRIHYEIIPTDYYQELLHKGGRSVKKADGFLSFAMDAERGNYHTDRYWAKRWHVSPSTANLWKSEFEHELDRFEEARRFKREEQKRYAKNQAEQIEQTKSNKSSNDKAQDNELCEYEAEQIEQTKSNKEIILDSNNNTHARKRFAEDFFMIYRLNNGKFTGARDSAIEEYMKIDDVDRDQLLLALWAYRDSGEQMVGATKFLKDRVYLSYMKISISVMINGVWTDGEYDSVNNMFVDIDSNKFTLTASRMTELFAKDEMKFKKVAA